MQICMQQCSIHGATMLCCVFMQQVASCMMGLREAKIYIIKTRLLCVCVFVCVCVCVRCSSLEYTPTRIYLGIIWARTEYTPRV